MTYTTLELRSIAKAMKNEGIELITGMERNSVREYLLYNNHFTINNGPLSDPEIDTVIRYYYEDETNNNANQPTYVDDSYYQGEASDIVTGAVALGIVGVIASVLGFLQYKSRKYIMPVMFILFAICMSITSVYESCADSKFVTVLVVIVCLAAGVGLSFLNKKIDSMVSKGNSNMLLTFAFVPLFLTNIVNMILLGGFDWTRAITMAIIAAYTVLMYLKKEKIAAIVIMTYFAVYFFPALKFADIDTVTYGISLLSFVIAGFYILGCIKDGSKADKAILFILDIALAFNSICYAKAAYKFAYMLFNARIIMGIAILEFVEIFVVYGAINLAKEKAKKKEIINQ